ncbi:MAG: PAS domain S-box protein [Candidatus Bathyarchaeia archaeon]|jgi:PAS domain S-box-containing protein
MEKAPAKHKEISPSVIPLPQIELNLGEVKQKRLHILYVDDDASFLEVSKQILSLESSFEVDTAESVEEACTKMESASYDAIVSDYEMPIKNGLDFLMELREQKTEIPFILLTGKGREEIVIKALNLGADGYVNKQGNPETVYGELTHYIRQSVEKKQAKSALNYSEKQLEAVIMNAPIGIAASHSASKLFETANATFCKILGYTQDELRNLTFSEITHPDDLSENVAKVENLKAGRIPTFSLEKRYIRKDGSIIYGKLNASALRDKDGKISLFIMELEDITERKKMEEKVREDRDMLEALTQSIGAGFVIISKDYHIIYANNFIREYKGDSIGKLCYTVLNTLNAPCSDCGVAKIFAGKTEVDSHEYFSTTLEGRPYWVEIVASPIRNKNGNITAASEICVDITEKKQREKELRESREEFKALFNSNPQAVAYSDENFCVISINPKFTEVFGFTPEEVRGKNLIDILVPEELKQEMQNNIEKSGSHAVSFQSKRKRKDGSTLQVFVSLASVSVGDKRIGSVTVYKDMTNEVAAEEKIEAALKHSEMLNEKLSVIGSFTRHDVRNKLMTIEGNAYLVKKHAGSDPKINQYLNQISLAVTNITCILEFAKNYESLGSEQRTLTDVGKAIDQAASLFSELKGAKITNECRGFNILADSMLTTVFHNLIDNSLKYGKNLTQIKVYHRKEKDGSERIIYEDDGGGIDEEAKTHLFVKGFGHGTGFGLYLIKRTCDIYGWAVKETGDLGKGARFEFDIPRKR